MRPVKFELLGDNLEGKGLPLVAWHLKEQEEYDGLPIRPYTIAHHSGKLWVLAFCIVDTTLQAG